MNLSDRGAAAPQQLAAALHSSAGGHNVDIGQQVRPLTTQTAPAQQQHS